MGQSIRSARFLIESRLRQAAGGDAQACYDLGIVYSSGAEGVDIDLIEAHKWFNIAAAQGSERAASCRAEISDEMSAREIVEAQKMARAWLRGCQSQAA
jgi:TPR repeat protein